MEGNTKFPLQVHENKVVTFFPVQAHGHPVYTALGCPWAGLATLEGRLLSLLSGAVMSGFFKINFYVEHYYLKQKTCFLTRRGRGGVQRQQFLRLL